MPIYQTTVLIFCFTFLFKIICLLRPLLTTQLLLLLPLKLSFKEICKYRVGKTQVFCMADATCAAAKRTEHGTQSPGMTPLLPWLKHGPDSPSC